MGGGGGYMDLNGNGNGMVDIPDAIPVELSYQVKYEGEEEGQGTSRSDGGRAKNGPTLAVELDKSQDLRVRDGQRGF